MAITQNTYTGNGSTTTYSFTFQYLKTTDIKVSLDGVITTAYTLSNATTVTFTTAPASGAAIRIFRDTNTDNLNATFYPGSAIRSSDLNNNFTQNLYVTQEADFDVATANTTANTAKTTANTALTNSATAISTANAASTTANTADTNASAAVTTANAASATATTASTDAASAITTANTALTNASAAVTTANAADANATTALNNSRESNGSGGFNTAIDKANAAVTTANSASTSATSAVSTANTADTNATTALNTANAASAAVSNAVAYTLIANVAAIPGSPSNNDYIEIGNSTGVESFSPLSGVPSGFVGASGLTVRLRYDSSATSWVWMSYFANDSEDRYFTKANGNTNTTNIGTKMPLAGGTFTGAVSFDDDAIIKGDSTNGSGALTLNCENNTHGVKIKGPPHSAAASYTLTLPNDAGTSGNVLKTDGSGTTSWGSADVVNDTTPQLGGDLDVNGNEITGANPVIRTGSLGTTKLIQKSSSTDVSELRLDHQNLEWYYNGALTLSQHAGTDLDVASGVRFSSPANGSFILRPSANTNAQYYYYWPPNGGSANYVLTTDGSGNMSWTAPSTMSEGKAIAFAMVFG